MEEKTDDHINHKTPFDKKNGIMKLMNETVDQIYLSKEGTKIGIIKEKDIMIIGTIFPTLFLDKIYRYLIKFSKQKKMKIFDKDDVYTLNDNNELLKNNDKVHKVNESSNDKSYNNIKFSNLLYALFLFFLFILLILLSSLIFSSSTHKKNKNPNLKVKLLLTNSISTNDEDEITLLKYLIYQIILNYKGLLSGITFLIQFIKNFIDSKKKKNKLISTIISEIKKIKGNEVCFVDKNQLIEMSSSYNIKKGEFIHKYLSDVNNELLKETTKYKDNKNKNNSSIYIGISSILFVLAMLIILLFRNFEYISDIVQKIYSEIIGLISASNDSSISESKIDKVFNLFMNICTFIFGEGFVYVGMNVALNFINREDSEVIDCILKEIYYELDKKKLSLKEEEKYTCKNGLNLEEIKKIIKNYYEKDNNIDDILLSIREKLTMNNEIEIVLNENKLYYILRNKENNSDQNKK